jgi:DNA repair protein RadD
MKPFSFQSQAVQSLFEYFTVNSGNPLIAMPTGTGKSVVIAEFLKQVYTAYPHTRVMMLTHVKELIAQNEKRLLQLWPEAPVGVHSAGLKRRDLHHPIIFAGIASVSKNPFKFGKVDLVIIDEAHLVSDNDTTTYRKFIAALHEVNPHLKTIGLTATPFRKGVGCLTEGGLFTDICFDITTPESFHRLILEGFMSPLVPKRMKQYLDTSGVHMLGGDYKLSELQLAVDKESITRAALLEAIKYGKDRKKWLIFAAGVEHAEHIAQELTTLGIKCEAVHSKMADKERDRILDDFCNGDLRAVSNNSVLTTGFDNPAIDMIICLRPTTSVGLWVQLLGRGTRALYAPGYDLSTQESRLAAISAGGKGNCLVLDFARNTQRLGPINDPIMPRKKGKRAGQAPVKACPLCDTYTHISTRFCESCGYQFTFETKIVATSSNEELLSGSFPVVVELAVDKIEYAHHQGRNGKMDTLKVSYWCGYLCYEQYICFGHTPYSFPHNKAKEWWWKRTNLSVPVTINEALSLVREVKQPTHIRIWVNKKFPEILDYCFDGSAFGKQETDPLTVPAVKVEKKVEEYLVDTYDDYDDDDDDIPF